ncbi:hypothetical protein [Bacillus methanolicus]|uniref:Uncharacterized protein n=1 Tax=Bacillus methanolicus (strain MGA3 / ATCC 53907) TaxID=796606 RepID=I3E763_BACMM|nr:hypothetical protein [Bacillus methanolicus]AIE59167.1 hypothetical protein BMMGA3_03630 [Bacillus methanolicus MGA3]EIJ82334.1 hypothetical protein MGA3_03770 [Bacillus methanolicus MGA3]
MIYRFYNQDKEYESWCKENQSGFVFNYYGGTLDRADMNKIHKVVCPFLWRKADEGKRTTTYENVCSENLDDLIEFVKNERGSSWSFCKGVYCFGE